MQKQIIFAGALAAIGANDSRSISVLALGVTPYDQLQADKGGNKVHSGIASGEQEVHSLRSSIKFGNGKPATITLTDPVTGTMLTMSTAAAEVAFAQLLPHLAAINQSGAAA